VGVRHSTYYGRETAASLARGLARAGVTIVAGLTEGIEASAHHAALQAGRPTIAVVAGKPNNPYPPGQKHLHAKLLEHGCVVGVAQRQSPATRSQSGERDQQDPLLERNRLIAELGQVVVLVEATGGAAAMQTVETALELGREVAAVPGRPADVATALARLSQREHLTADGDLVFAGVIGGHLDSNKVRKVYRKALEHAGLRRLRFHDLRHTFGTRAVEKADSILELKEWMGHANVQTTMRYLHYKSKADAARRLSEALTEESTPRELQPGPAQTATETHR
jgi:hypothetical protein